MNKQEKGKLIVLYGINNLGKSTQAELLVENLNKEGIKTEYLKYPIYNLSPSGPTLNNYLRQGNSYKLNAREAQIIYCLNRTQYEKTLIKKLETGINIIAEDYTGTGIAWGMGAGVDENFLKQINSHLIKEDLVFLFDGNRFLESQEKNHKHETNNELTNKVKQAHLKLAQEYNWIKINANLSIEAIQEQLLEQTLKKLDSNYKTENEIEKIIKELAPDFKKLHEEDDQDVLMTQVLKVEKIDPKAKLPSRAHTHDAGLDFYANDYYSIYPREKVLIKTGVKIAIPNAHVGLIWDKSGLAKEGIHTMAGVIDAGYRGEIIINIINLGDNIYNISPGQKVAQMLIQKTEFPIIMETNIEDKTDRGDKGFGSSGLF